MGSGFVEVRNNERSGKETDGYGCKNGNSAGHLILAEWSLIHRSVNVPMNSPPSAADPAHLRDVEIKIHDRSWRDR